MGDCGFEYRAHYNHNNKKQYCHEESNSLQEQMAITNYAYF